MRREFKVLIAVALLLQNSGRVFSQDVDSALDDSDLETLLDDVEGKPKIKAPEAKAAPQPTPEATPTPEPEAIETPVEPEAPVATDAAPENLSSETVDLEALEKDIDAPSVEPGLDIPSTDIAVPTPPISESLEPIDLGLGDDTAKSETPPVEESPTSGTEDIEGLDDLESLKSDIGDNDFTPATDVETAKKENPPTPETKEAKAPKATSAPTITTNEPAVFEVGREERDLLSLAQNIQGQISDNEWSELATAAKAESYTVVQNDWLFKISKKIFGSGFYYPKIWALNTFITNPHLIEPGMVLSFTTGSSSQAPEFKLGTFSDDELSAEPGTQGTGNATDLANFGEDAKPSWLTEKDELSKQGIYFQYASEETMEDLARAGEQALNKEYENYEPPRSEFEIIVPNNYDKNGFDKNSRIFYSFKEGFYLSTFLSTNIVQDFGSIVNGPDENIFFTREDRAYVKFDESINALPGDKFSVYSAGGIVKNSNSDREGYKYTIVGHIKLIRKIRDKWEVVFIEVSGTPQRGDRITAYTPKIDRITRTYNSRLVEAAILASFQPGQSILGFGDVIYLDRGRADGVEMGNVFEVYGFKDRVTKKNITDQPTYKMGELTVITLTDNFATVIVSKSQRDFYAGDIAITKTKEAHLKEMKALKAKLAGDKETMGGKALEELDVELNLENLNDDLLKQADKIQLTEDELAELERQEREKSVIKDSEKDLKALERLENEIESAEKILNDAKLDEDKLLENENLNDIEKKQGRIDQDSLDEIEENLGKRYIDEDLNSKDNPFGLTEFDVEEVDELLNVEKKGDK